MKEFKDRWHRTEESAVIHGSIIKCIADGRSLSDIQDVAKVDGKFDLRGVTLPLEFNESGVATKNFTSKNLKVEAVDFSFATLYNTVWENCIFRDVLFAKTKLDHAQFWACQFENVVFENSYLNEVLMNGTTRNNESGVFRNVIFKSSNMKDTYYSNSLFEKCTFDNCKLEGVDFNGSRFEHCKFIGKLPEVVFRGHQLVNRNMDKWRNPLPNKMLSVNFEDALLESVMFLDGIDLSTCIFPHTEDYIIIRRNKQKLFEEAKRIIEQTWAEPVKKIALAVIEKGYLSPRKQNVNIEIVDRHYLQSKDPILNAFGKAFFTLIKDLNTNINA
jgi:uncharacterized protein YjbI with pentapeptide repeats